MTFFQKILLGFALVNIMCILNFLEYDKNAVTPYWYSLAILVLLFILSIIKKKRN